jgi:hypothetical protein
MPSASMTSAAAAAPLLGVGRADDAIVESYAGPAERGADLRGGAER